MSEHRRNRRNRDRNPKTTDETTIQPKILLKTKEKDKFNENFPVLGATVRSAQPQSQMTLALRTEPAGEQQASPSPIVAGTGTERSTLTALSCTSPAVGGSSSTSTPVPVVVETTPTIAVQPVTPMTRPVALSLAPSSYQSHKSCTSSANSDFLVVGVVGRQGAGKSTILNLLAAEKVPLDVRATFFKEKQEIFSTQPKLGKLVSSPRTENIEMFITKDRMILLDTPPLLLSSSKKEETTEIERLIAFLTTCHLLIVVDEVFDLSLVRLLLLAESLKESTHGTLLSDYSPSVLFVKNKAKRNDFLPAGKARTANMLRHFFQNSQLRTMWGEAQINYVVFPDVLDHGNDLYSLEVLVKDLRNRVCGTIRNPMTTAAELSETQWLQIFTNFSSMNHHNFFFNLYTMRIEP